MLVVEGLKILSYCIICIIPDGLFITPHGRFHAGTKHSGEARTKLVDWLICPLRLGHGVGGMLVLESVGDFVSVNSLVTQRVGDAD